MAIGFLDALCLLILAAARPKKMSHFSSTCQICGSKTGCNHTASKPKQWDDENHLHLISSTKAPIMNEPIFARCNLCPSDVHPDYLTEHIKRHVQLNYVQEPEGVLRLPASTISTVKSATSSTPVEHKPPVVFDPVNPEEVKAFLNLIPSIRVSPYETFKFRPVRDVSVVSSSSKSGKYSDIALTIWFKEAMSSYTGTTVGVNNSYVSKASDRLQINICYDSLDDFYTLSGKIYRRTSYSSVYDAEEGTIPMRVCEQADLRQEIENCLLFFTVSPRVVYRLFRRRLGRPILSKKDNPKILLTDNHDRLLEEKPVASSVYHSPYAGFDDDDIQSMM